MIVAMSDLAVQQERDRLRAEAACGVCPTCGRMENSDLERRLRQYAEANSTLHAQLMTAQGS